MNRAHPSSRRDSRVLTQLPAAADLYEAYPKPIQLFGVTLVVAANGISASSAWIESPGDEAAAVVLTWDQALIGALASVWLSWARPPVACRSC